MNGEEMTILEQSRPEVLFQKIFIFLYVGRLQLIHTRTYVYFTQGVKTLTNRFSCFTGKAERTRMFPISTVHCICITLMAYLGYWIFCWHEFVLIEVVFTSFFFWAWVFHGSFSKTFRGESWQIIKHWFNLSGKNQRNRTFWSQQRQKER